MNPLSCAMSSRKISAVIAAASAIVMLAAMFLLARPAGAIPPAQAQCTTDTTITITPANGWVPLTNGITTSVTSPQTIKAQVTADVGVDSGAEVRLGWGFNGGPPQEGNFGPANFANHQQFFETRTTFALIAHASGNSTVTPFVRVSGPAGSKATFLHRCIAVEVATS